MFVKLFSILLSYFLGKTMSHSEGQNQLANISMAAVRRVFILLTTVTIGVIILSGGLYTVLADILVSSHQQPSLFISNVSIVGFSLMGIAVLGIIVAFQKSYWTPAPPTVRPEEKASPLNEALARLVVDFVEERKHARETEPVRRASANQYEETMSEPPVYM